MALSPRLRVLLISVVLLAALAALVWVLSARYGSQPVTPHALPQGTEPTPPPAPAASVNASSNSATPTANASPQAAPSASTNTSSTTEATPQATPPSSPGSAPQPPSPSSSPPLLSTNSTTPLVVPVAGVRPDELHDTYTEARSEGRVHNAIDIPAARGTPVLAAADGKIIKLFNSDRGGITIYQLAGDNRTVYYYAHLERYADGLAEGHLARRGETIAYVGDTGNAGAGNYHLHFSVSIVSDPKRWWEGTNVNPYPLLRGDK